VEDPLPAFLCRLQPLPVLAHAARRPSLHVAEHVRVTGDELRVHAAGDALEVTRPALGEQLRQEVRLEEQVAQLVEQLRVVAREGRVRDLVGLLDRVRHDRLRGLLAVPRAVAAQPLGQLLELEQRLGEAQPVVVAALAGGA